MTPSLKKATPFHVSVLPPLVAASGRFMHLNENRISTAPRDKQVLVQVAPKHSGSQEQAVEVAAADPVAQVSEEAAPPAQPPVQPAMRETTAQKRARYAPYHAGAPQGPAAGAAARPLCAV